MTRFNLPIPDRTFERTQGCWSCKHFATAEESLQHWKTACRPREEARIADAKQLLITNPPDIAAVRRLAATHANSLCPCGSKRRYSKCCRQKDQAADAIMRKVEGIERSTDLLDGAERAIAEGRQALCKVPGSASSDFKSDRYLCDKWSAAPGASVAREGQKPDLLPEELKELIGDGN